MLTAFEAGAGNVLQNDAFAPARRLRVVALVNNPCIVDARVIREATALAHAGHDVHVLAHWASDLPEVEQIEGVIYNRICVRPSQKAEALASVREQEDKAEKSTLSSGGKLDETIHAIEHLFSQIGKIFDWLHYWTVPRLLDVIGRFLRAILRKILNLIRAAFRLLRRSGDALARSIVTGTGAELLRHARSYYHPAVDLKPDVVHAHDLYTLLAGYLIARKTGAKLIYDSHELEVGRNGNFSRWELWLRARSERFLIKKADAVITVCDSIADYLQKLYGIERPTVIHNAPSVNPVKKGDPDVRSQLKLPKKTPIALYVGSVTINRGLENCVRALPHTEDVHLVCVGPRHKPTEELIVGEAEELGVRSRLHLVDPVPHDQVTSFVRSADVSLVTIQDVCLSYRFCFPNKLLESLLTSLPIVVARLVELEQIVEMTGAGVVVDETDPVDIARGINQIIADRKAYVPTPDVIRNLKATYSLEVQMGKLMNLYDRLAPVSASV